MRAVSAVLFLTLAAAAWAQPPVIRRVEFDDAVRTAIERNPSIATANVAIAEANDLLDLSKSAVRPTVTASINNVTLDARRGFSGGTTQPQNQFAFGASASMPLLAATSRSEVNQARDQITVATENAADVRRRVAMSTAEAYLSVLAAQRQIGVDERALEAAQAHLDYANKRLEGGVGSRLNQVRAAQVVSEEEARVENVKLILLRAQEALGVLLAENGPVDAGAIPTFEPPAAGAEAQWMANRADVRAQAAVIQAAERVVHDAWKVWTPTAAVSFDPQIITPAGLFQPSRTWRLVFSVSQPVFVSGLKAGIALTRIALDRAQVQRIALEIQARSEIRLAEESVRSYERILASAKLSAEQANEVLRISTAAFEVGATTNIEVIDAQRSARDADTTVTLADDAVRRAQLDLLSALGLFPK